jgi:hypothetical protein
LNDSPSLAAIIAWSIAGLCWLWLFRSSRHRVKLIKKLAEEYSGFIRNRFSLPTLMQEPAELAWTRIIAGEPVQMSIRYVMSLTGQRTMPMTVFEIEFRESRFGPDGGYYSGPDLVAGRGLFMGGANLTEVYRKFCLITPHSGRFRINWSGARFMLTVPGLLDDREEVWVRHCIRFLEELAGGVLGEPTGKGEKAS